MSERGQKPASEVKRRIDKTLIFVRHVLSCHFTVLPAEHKYRDPLTRKDHIEHYRDWNQFQSNKMAEIPLFMEMKCALTNDKPDMETIKRSFHDATDPATFNHLLQSWVETQSHSWLQCVTCFTQRCLSPQAATVNPYRLCYDWDAGLIFSSFHFTSPSCRQIAGVGIRQENHKMFETAAQSSG